MGDLSVRKVSAREGYDLWSATYDETPNPVVAMDARVAPGLLAPQAGEAILDAGCGTGRNLKWIVEAGAKPVGLDFSNGMLRVAAVTVSGVPLVRADLHAALPFPGACFDAVLCALIGEHLERIELCFREFERVLKPRGRLAFTVYHPDMAARGVEANFRADGTEYRLGAVRYTTGDYLEALRAAGFRVASSSDHWGDDALVRQVPEASNMAGRLVLWSACARRR